CRRMRGRYPFNASRPAITDSSFAVANNVIRSQNRTVRRRGGSCVVRNGATVLLQFKRSRSNLKRSRTLSTNEPARMPLMLGHFLNVVAGLVRPSMPYAKTLQLGCGRAQQDQADDEAMFRANTNVLHQFARTITSAS